MKRDVFITGGSGALGPHLISELLRNPDVGQLFVLIRPHAERDVKVHSLLQAVQRLCGGLEPLDFTSRILPLAGDVTIDGLGLSASDAEDLRRRVSVVIHAAADTRFAAVSADLQRVNVDGTHNVIELARGFSQLRQLLFVSTTCVAGKTQGSIPEQLILSRPEFLNHYECSKWEAERLVADSDLPARIARLSTCIGDANSGFVHRFGAIHRLLQWFERGLVPLIPGDVATPIDLVPTNVAARWLAHVTTLDPASVEVCQIAAGNHAVALGDLMEFVVEHLSARLSPWKTKQLEPPLIVNSATYEEFRRSVVASRDALFGQVIEAANSFLPALVYPKQFQTTRAEALFGGDLPQFDLREALGKVIDFGLRTSWGRHQDVVLAND